MRQSASVCHIIFVYWCCHLAYTGLKGVVMAVGAKNHGGQREVGPLWHRRWWQR